MYEQEVFNEQEVINTKKLLEEVPQGVFCFILFCKIVSVLPIWQDVILQIIS